MEIKKLSKKSDKAKKIKKILQYIIRKKIYLILIIILLSMYAGVHLRRWTKYGGQVYYIRQVKYVLRELDVPMLLNWVKGFTAQPERISIDISHIDYQRLEYNRMNTLKGNRQYDYVPAVINHNGKSVKVDIRLKGDRESHIEDKIRWSFRIKAKNDETILGMKNFSIHKPKERVYIYEWIFHQALKREGVLSLRYEFIDVTLNGKKLGIYAMEEHFEKRLLEHNEQREGPIIRFNEDFVTFERASVAPFNSKEWTASENIDMTQKAISLLELFKDGKLKTGEVFDIKKLATFFAIADLTATVHGSIWKSMRFYYNPITSKLEPVGFDGHTMENRENVLCAAEVGVDPESVWSPHKNVYGEWLILLFNNRQTFDVEFFKEYIKAIERMSKDSYLENLFSEIENDLNYNMALISKDTFNLLPFSFNKNIYIKEQNHLKRILKPKKGLHAYYFKGDKNNIVIEFRNIHSLPIEVINISHEDANFLSEEQNKIIFPPRTQGFSSDFFGYERIAFALPQDFIFSDEMVKNLKVHYRILGMDDVIVDDVYPWKYLAEDFLEDDFIRQHPNVAEFDFLIVDESKKRIDFKPGSWDIEKNLIIPKGYNVVAGDKVRINLLKNAKILSYSPLRFFGSEESRIVVSSEDSTGQGIAVMETEKESKFEYVSFANLSNPAQNGWSLTGAITFYQAPVKFYKCEFSDNKNGDDYLNIVRSDFELDSCYFQRTFADALDVDFSRGLIKNSIFADLGNDAIDASGSILELENISIKNAKDKGLSAGEKSYVNASGVKVENSNIAVSGKDMSEVIIDGLSIFNGQVGFAVFQKKSEFGPALVEVLGLKVNNAKNPYMVEIGSSLSINGEPIKGDLKNVKEMLYED